MGNLLNNMEMLKKNKKELKELVNKEGPTTCLKCGKTGYDNPCCYCGGGVKKVSDDKDLQYINRHIIASLKYDIKKLEKEIVF